jgi:hypothetical protein
MLKSDGNANDGDVLPRTKMPCVDGKDSKLQSHAHLLAPYTSFQSQKLSFFPIPALKPRSTAS